MPDNVLVEFEQSGGGPVVATFDQIIARIREAEELTGNPAATELRISTETARSQIAALEESYAALREDEAALSETEITVRVAAAEEALAALEAQAEAVRVALETPIVIPPVVIPPSPPSPLPAELTEIEAAAQRAQSNMEAFSAAAVEGTTRITKPATQAQLAINDLTRAIETARAAGSPVPPGVEAQLAGLTAQYAANVARAGEVKAAQRQVGDALKVSAIAAGESRGQYQSLNDVIRVVSPEFGNLANQISGSFVAVFIAIQAVEALKGAYKATGEVIENLVIVEQKVTDAQIREAEASRLVAKAHAGILVQANELGTAQTTISARRQKDIGREVEAIERLSQVAKEEGKVSVDTAQVITDKAKSAIEVIEKRLKLENYADDTERQQLEGAKERLVKLISSYEGLTGAANKAANETKNVVSEFRRLHDSALGNAEVIGLQGVALIDLYNSLVQGKNLSAQNAQALVADAEKIRQEYERLGIAIPAQLLAVIAAIESRAKDLSSSLKRLGIAQSVAIRQSIDDLDAYGKEVEKGGKITEEQAQKIATATREIIKQLNELPESQRKGSEATIKYLKETEAEYETIALIIKQKLAIENVASINSNIAAVRALVSEFGSLSSVTHAQADRVISDARKILEQIEILPKAQQKAYKETVLYLQQLIAAYQLQAEKTTEYSKQGAAGIEEATKKALEYYQKQIDKSHELVAQSKRDTESLLATLKQRAASLAQQPDQKVARLDELRHKDTLTPDDINEQSKLTQELQKQSVVAKDAAKSQTELAIANSKVSASSDEIAKTVETYRSNINAAQKDGLKLEEAQKQAIDNYLTRLQQLADSGKATAENVKGTLGAVDSVLKEAQANAQIAAEATKARTELILNQSKRLVDSAHDTSVKVSKAAADQADSQQQASDKTVAANQSNVDSQNQVTLALDVSGRFVITQKSRVDGLSKSTDDATKSTDDLSAATKNNTEAAKEAETKSVDQKQKLDDLKTGTDALKESDEGLRTTSDILAVSLDKVVQSANPLLIVFRAIAELHLEKTFQPIVDLVNQAGRLGELTASLAKFIEDVSKLDTDALAKKVDLIKKSLDSLARSEENAGKVAAARTTIMRDEVAVAIELRDVLREIAADATPTPT